MPLIFGSIFPNWVVWLLTIESVLVGIGFVILWARGNIDSFKVMLAGWIGATVLLFAVTLAFIYIIIPIVAVLLAALLVVLLVALVASLFRRKRDA